MTEITQKKSDKMDIVNGPLVRNMLYFAWPIMIANILQITFHMADTIVIGRFAGQQGLAAVGTSGPVTIFFMWGLNGLSVGANVLISQLIGEKAEEKVRNAVFSAVMIGLVFGTAISVFGFFAAGLLMKMLSVPADIMHDAVLYLRLYFLTGIAIGVYDFCAAVLRADGDTRHPTLYLSLAGALNVFLNLLFVIVFHMGVAGVALATIISQYFSMILIIYRLLNENSVIRLDRRRRLDLSLAGKMLRFGIPSALQNQLFAFSNMVVQSNINTFGTIFVAANTAANAVEEYVYVFVDAFPQASITFTSQMYGAGEHERIRKTTITAFLLCGIGAFLLGCLILVFGNELLGFFTNDPEVIFTGMIRLRWVTFFLFINGLLDVIVGSIRGMGYAVLPTVVTLLGVCGFRILYLFTVFRRFPTPQVLYSCFPLSWVLTLAIQSVLWLRVYNKIGKEGRA